MNARSPHRQWRRILPQEIARPGKRRALIGRGRRNFPVQQRDCIGLAQ